MRYLPAGFPFSTIKEKVKETVACVFTVSGEVLESMALPVNIGDLIQRSDSLLHGSFGFCVENVAGCDAVEWLGA